MPQYRRLYIPGGTYFFTVVSYLRRSILIHPLMRDALRRSIRVVRSKYPFEILACVLLPDHLHCIWRLPDNDADYSIRWAQIKRMTSTKVMDKLHIPALATKSMRTRKELTIWQPRFWEHWVRSDTELTKMIAYIHFNPVKHGLVNRVEDWPYSTYHHHQGGPT